MAPPQLQRFQTLKTLYDKLEEEDALVKKALIPFVDEKELRDRESLSNGPKGVTFSAMYNNKRYAVKQFDLIKDFKWYQRELLGYAFLHDVWGEYVPKLEFIAVSTTGMVRFLGMALGEEALSEERAKDIPKILGKLEREYGFRLYRSDAIVVNGKPLVTDLGNWEEIKEENSDPSSRKK